MEQLRIDRDELIAFCTEVFRKCGVSADEAGVCSDVLVQADVRGIPSHGVARLKRYVNGLKEGLMLPDDSSVVLKQTPVSILVDAKGGLGAPVATRTMDTVIDKARESGMAVGLVKNSNHYGIAGYYAMKALEEDMIGFSMTNTAALGVPTFGKQVKFGTNPLAFAAPADKEKAFVLDMSTTVVTRGKIEVYNRAGKELNPGWAVTKEGKTAVQADALLEDMFNRSGGGIVPLGGESEVYGGHKGYGLAVLVDIMTGVLSGSLFGADIYDKGKSSALVSQCFGAMKIDLFMEPAEFRSNMDKMLHDLRTMDPAEGQDRVYYAGLKEFEAEEQALRYGVTLSQTVLENLRELAGNLGIESELA